ncbi:hypothetical protein B0T10DRAFT_114507 [Thelonectria olida]|uniref:Uncharacterized protein n=1 Tax=Thelonectria olida TaxID=1576542 RepID=A0A9P8WGT8_9HYPO|nr:hypothetical protein B0T10DRAFT_114507 [Thelonectria olida]
MENSGALQSLVSRPAIGAFSPADWRNLQVGRCHTQTAEDRFGLVGVRAIRAREEPDMPFEDLELPFDWPGLSLDDDPGSSIFKTVPTMQLYRNNLTALSQVHNLYFVAYQSQIFVYRPRTVPTQRLPCLPDFRLAPAPTSASTAIGGTVDENNPHLINHIITGFLGKEEIVLACYDDGDVAAYYVERIADQLPEHRYSCTEKVPQGAPTPILHENVGDSAWGLAIHQRSQLIAVSSNRHEVTVFAPGLASNHMPSAECSLPEMVAQRHLNWRIVIALAINTSNIPNLCFIDDDKGYADKVCAIDINACVWIADIWRSRQPLVCIDPLRHLFFLSEEFPLNVSRGWGILAIHESSFVNVKTKEELFGLASDRVEILQVDKPGNKQSFVNVRQIIGQICIPSERARFRGELTFMSHNDQSALDGQIEGQYHVDGQLLLDEENDDESVEEGDGHSDQNNEETSDEGGGTIHEDDTDGSDEDDGHFGAPLHGVDIEIEGAEVAHLPPMSMWEPGSISAADELVEAFNGELSEGPWNEGPYDESDDELSDSEAEMIFIPAPLGISTADNPESLQDIIRGITPVHDCGQYGNVYLPHTESTVRMHEYGRCGRHKMEFLIRAPDYNTIVCKDGRRMDKYAHRLHLLRTYEKDIEMWGFERPNLKKESQEVNAVCTDAMRFGRFRELQRITRHFHATSRLNMIAHAPEIGLVVIGSPTGRVLLVTLTRMIVPAERPEGKWSHGFRVERILPDEDVHRKISRPLHGMALSPVQSDEGPKAIVPRTYRLMLHYRSHDILSYEISREENGEVSVGLF